MIVNFCLVFQSNLHIHIWHLSVFHSLLRFPFETEVFVTPSLFKKQLGFTDAVCFDDTMSGILNTQVAYPMKNGFLTPSTGNWSSWASSSSAEETTRARLALRADSFCTQKNKTTLSIFYVCKCQLPLSWLWPVHCGYTGSKVLCPGTYLHTTGLKHIPSRLETNSLLTELCG